MADAHDNERYQDAPNFCNRFIVETAYPDGPKDHREGFSKQEYFKGGSIAPGVNKDIPPVGKKVKAQKRPSMTQGPGVANPAPLPKKSKTKTDAALNAANTKDLKQRNLQ